jgi:hypothetical protein
LANSDATYSGESTFDYAAALSGACDVDGDGYDEIVVGALGDDDAGSSAGAAYLIYGRAAPTSTSLAGADAKFTGEAAGDFAGGSVACVGDVDGDSLDDLLVGARYNDGAASNAGAAYFIFGGALTGNLSLGVADAIRTGDGADEHAGVEVAAAGDVDDDGFMDALVASDQGSGGAAFLILGLGP